MGDPRRLGKTYESPRKVLDADRIAHDGKLKGEYGLKNTREVWKTNQFLKRARREARKLLSKGAQGAVEGKPLLEKLARLGVTKPEAKLDDILTLELRDLLGRRLQTVVLKRGLARSIKQSRQLIVQGYVSVNGRKVTIPSYLVKASEEPTVGYYKAFNLDAATTPAKDAPEKPSEQAEAPAGG
jgi:small subunit ribosomal protein S4